MVDSSQAKGSGWRIAALQIANPKIIKLKIIKPKVIKRCGSRAALGL